MKKTIVTISREFGSGGRTIGKKLAEKLNIPVYDREIIEQVAKETGYDPEFIKEYGEHSMSSSKLNYYFLPRDSKGLTLEENMWISQVKVIMDLVKKGPCVIVGRCADFILKDNEEAIHVFIYADEKFKEDRIINTYGENGVNIEKRIKDKDKRRSVSYEYFTGRTWGNKNNYDVMLNSSQLGIDACVEIISDLLK